MKNILITGGAGYKGSILAPLFLDLGFQVTIFDTFWFGDYLDDRVGLTKLKADMRSINEVDMPSFDYVIHLASIVNDPAADLDPTVAWETSALGTKMLLDRCIDWKTQKFIYASSGSVYGIKDEERVTEELLPEPISTYNKVKMVTEKLALSYANQLPITIARPATVCGMSPRQRMDVVVNLLTWQALELGEITVLGGDQLRPNIHIQDICAFYIESVLNLDKYIGVYNLGFENISVKDLADLISRKTRAKVNYRDSNDPRSYRMCSDKVLNEGFNPKFSIENAIDEMIDAYQRGELKNQESSNTVNFMRDSLDLRQ